jgi:hypothetical protein
MTIFLVLHHEIFKRGPNDYIADDVVLHVASSVKKALVYIKSSIVEPYSWWEIQEQKVDSMEWPKRIGWYGRRGGKLRCPPFNKAVHMFKKCESDPSHHLNVGPTP